MSLHVGSLRRFGRGNHTKVLHRGGGLWSSLGAAVCSFSPLWEAPLCFLLIPARCRWCLASTSLHLSVLTHPSTKPFHSFLHVRQAHYCSGLRRQRGRKKTVQVLHNLVFSCCCGCHGPRIVALYSTFFLCRDLWGGGNILHVLRQLKRQQQKCCFGSISGQILKVLPLQNEK